MAAPLGGLEVVRLGREDAAEARPAAHDVDQHHGQVRHHRTQGGEGLEAIHLTSPQTQIQEDEPGGLPLHGSQSLLAAGHGPAGVAVATHGGLHHLPEGRLVIYDEHEVGVSHLGAAPGGGAA